MTSPFLDFARYFSNQDIIKEDLNKTIHKHSLPEDDVLRYLFLGGELNFLTGLLKCVL